MIYIMSLEKDFSHDRLPQDITPEGFSGGTPTYNNQISAKKAAENAVRVFSNKLPGELSLGTSFWLRTIRYFFWSPHQNLWVS